jgi:hypothetical protein
VEGLLLLPHHDNYYITISLCTGGFAENRLEMVFKERSRIDKNRFKHLKYFVKETYQRSRKLKEGTFFGYTV